MENNVRFRNHLSIVVEKLGVFVGVAVAFLFTNMDAVSDLAAVGFSAETLIPMLMGAGAILLMIVLVVGYNVLIWSRTWISLCDGSIVIERNTLHQKKNTIGIKNISNVNTEQNLFEMLIGTCKVKLDTNSLSTADSTDVKIVLKKADAEAFRAQVMALMQQTDGQTAPASEEVEQWDYVATSHDMIMHGLLSIRVTTVLIAVGSVSALVVLLSYLLRHGMLLESISAFLVNFLVLGGIAFSAIRNLVMGFLKYYDFKIARRGDKLVMRYGLFKKMNYTIPVSKINGLVVYQSMTARLTGHAMAEIINIGMGDDDAESEAFLCPYGKTAATMAHIRQFLPELAPHIDMRYDRQPVAVWTVWVWPMMLWALAFVATAIAGEWALAYWQMGAIMIDGRSLPLDGVLRERIVLALWSGALLLIGAMVVRRILRYFTSGSKLGEHYLLIVQGCAHRSYCWIGYPKIQYVRLQQNPAARIFKIRKGKVNILAAVRHQVQRLPYMPKANGELLKEKILKR